MFKATVLALLLFCFAVGQTDTTRPYPIDANHSTVGFNVSIMNGLSRVSGKFTDFTVTLSNDEKDITKSSITVVIKATSINTGIEARDKHLRSADFFDVEKYPEIVFKSDRIEKKGKQLTLIGTFSMHGVSKQMSVPFNVIGTSKDPTGKKMNLGYSARFAINRRDFGINWEHQTVKNFVGDNVEVEINLLTKALNVQ